MKKILLIGQAPPAQKQAVPYDTTMLYEWLQEIDISKDQAQSLFEFEAMAKEFPGYNDKGGHKLPTPKGMIIHYDDYLRFRIEEADKIILLGAVPKKFFIDNRLFAVWSDKKTLCLMHPSTRNRGVYKQTKSTLLAALKSFINS
jgi:uracil-DNA glycosylase